MDGFFSNSKFTSLPSSVFNSGNSVPNYLLKSQPNPLPHVLPDSLFDSQPNSRFNSQPYPLSHMLPDPLFNSQPNPLPHMLPDSLFNSQPNSRFNSQPSPLPHILDSLFNPQPNSRFNSQPNLLPDSLFNSQPNPLPHVLPDSLFSSQPNSRCNSQPKSQPNSLFNWLPDSMPDSCRKLSIVSRDEWGALKPKSTASSIPPAKKVIIHHSGVRESICHTKENCIAAAQRIQKLHMDGRGYDDIGYNFLIGGDGNVYGGRGPGIEGGHTLGQNKDSIGIVLIGDYEYKAPSDRVLQAVQDLIRCGVENGWIDPNYTLHGHGNFQIKGCPGQALYGAMKKLPHFDESGPYRPQSGVLDFGKRVWKAATDDHFLAETEKHWFEP